MTGRRCFLEEDEWQSIDVDDFNFPLMPANSNIYHEGLNHFATIPGIIERCQRFRDGDTSVDFDCICSEAKIVRSNMMRWFNKLQSEFRLPIRVLLPSPTDLHSPMPAMYEYCDIITATFAVNYSAYLVKLNTLFSSLGCTDHDADKNTKLSEDICMSVAYCSRGGFCGVQAIAFALPLALSTLPEHYSDWIREQINLLESIQESLTLRSAMLDD